SSDRRPKWVWIICIFYLLSVGGTVLSMAVVLSGLLPLDAESQAYFSNLGIIDYLSMIGLGLLNIVAVVLLFRLRKSAVFVFGLSLALNIALVLVHALTTNWLKAAGGSGPLEMLFGWLITVGVIQYARRLKDRGVLT